jgi:hypothetical protein
MRDVKTFGATGNGTTDDTLSIQAAIDAAIAGGGDTVLFPAGTYLVSVQTLATCLRVDGSDVTLFGDGGAVIKQALTATPSYVVHLGSLTNAVRRERLAVINVRIDCNGSTDTKGIRVGWVRTCRIESCTVGNVGSSPNSAAGISIAGKDASNRSTDLIVRDSLVHDIAGALNSDGIVATQVDRLSVENNIIRGTGRGVFLSGPSTYCTIRGNHMSTLADNGIRLAAASGGQASDIVGHVILGNSVQNAAIDGIRLAGLNHVCSDNVVQSAGDRGIKAEITQDCVISNNVVSGCGDEGILLASAPSAEYAGGHRGTIIIGNVVSQCGGAGIRVLGGGFGGSDLAIDLIISNNYCRRNAGGGLQLENLDSTLVLDNILVENADTTSAGDKQGVFVDMTLPLTSTRGITIRGNRAYDQLGSGNRQVYGCRLACSHAGATLNGVVIDHNDFSDCITWAVLVPVTTGALGPVVVRGTRAANSPGISLRAMDAFTDNTTSFGNIGDQNTNSVYRVSATQVLGARRTGWSPAGGTANRTTFNTATVTTAQLAQRVKALIDDFIAHGSIGT